MKRKRTPTPKVQPCPGSTFALQTQWEDWITDRHFWVFLERRVPGKFGCLEAMHAIVPKGRRKASWEPSSARRDIGAARWTARENSSGRPGVADDQAADFMQTIAREFPYPTRNEMFEEEMSNPLLAMALGDRYESSVTIGLECRK
jgi:hypothetical protein